MINPARNGTLVLRRLRLPRRIGSLCALLAITLAFGLPAVGVQAQSDNRSLHWMRWDVLIDQIDTTANSFRVKETYNLAIDSGPFHGGFRNIPLNRIDSIDNIQVTDNNTSLRMLNTANCPTSNPGVACYTATSIIQSTSSGSNSTTYSFTNAQEKITYVFTETLNGGDTRNVNITYTVHGALRSYAGGDQLYWGALATDRNFDVQASRITVQLPPGLTADTIATYPAWSQETGAAAGTLVFDSPGDQGSSNSVEVRIQYPHNPAMHAPGWQSFYDTIRNLNPVLTLIALVVSMLLLVGGILFAILRLTAHQRGLRSIVVPEYLTEPPSDLAPGVADALIHLSTQTRDVLGTLLDLARRGYLVIEQGNKSGGFVLHRTDKPVDSEMAVYERLMLDNMFRTGETRSLSDLGQKFYTTTEQIQPQLITTLLQKGYIKKRPGAVRLGWYGLGMLCFLVFGAAAVATSLLLALGLGLSPAITILPALVFLMLTVFYFVVAGMMPSRTPEGEQESAKWKAFKHYLENLKRYNGQPTAPVTSSASKGAATIAQSAPVTTASMTTATPIATSGQPLTPDDQFTRFIGYAVAFGVEHVWLPQVTPTLSYFPAWYYPGYMYGGRPYSDFGYGYNSYGSGQLGRPMMPDSMGGGMNIAGGGGGNFDIGRSLNQATTGLSDGLNSLSSGLTNMLNSASSDLTSRPPSSSSGGSGGGFSGGGGGGGGSSGGGGAGFF